MLPCAAYPEYTGGSISGTCLRRHNAFCISLLRNFMGTGSLLAFPGSMVGAFLAGMMYKMTKNNWATAAAEVVGTGVLGGLLAVPMAILLMGQEAGALAFVPSFLLSSFGGSVIAMILLKSPILCRQQKRVFENRRNEV